MVLKLLYLITFLDVFGAALFMPLNNIHMINLGASRFTNGVLGSLRAFFQLIIGPLIGSLSDTKGRRAMMLVIGVGLLVSNVLLLPQYLSIFFISRLILGGMSHVPLLIKTIVADVSTSEQQASIFGKIGALSGLAFIAGPIIGGHVNEWDNGFYYISWLLIGASIATIGLSLLMPETKKLANKEVEQKSVSKEMTAAFTNLIDLDWSSYWDIFALKCLAETGISIYFQLFGLVFIEVYQVSSKNMGYIIAIISLTGIVMNLMIGAIKEKFYSTDVHYKKRNLHGLLGFTIMFSWLYVHSSFEVYLVTMLLFSVFKTILDTTWNEMIVARTNTVNRGKVMGAFEGMLQIAGLITPLISGYISDEYGPEAAVKLCVFPLVAATILTTKIKKTNIVKSD